MGAADDRIFGGVCGHFAKGGTTAEQSRGEHRKTTWSTMLYAKFKGFIYFSYFQMLKIADI